MSIINAQALTVYYQNRRGIENVDLRIEQGDIFGFLGPNGSGKTTTIRVLMGYLKSTGGHAHILGQDCWKQSHLIKQNIGYLPGDLRLYPWMTGHSAMKIFGRIRHRNLKEAGSKLAGLFGLDMEVPVRKMSSGMRQKLGLLIALAHDPEVLILDEPTSALDPLAQQKLITLLQQRASEGTTVLFSSHSLSEVEQLCHRVAIIREGEIVTDKTLADLKKDARKIVTFTFSSEEEANHFSKPDFLSDNLQNGEIRSFHLDGNIQELIQWLSQQEFEDVSISPPDLENLFKEYYLSEGDPNS